MSRRPTAGNAHRATAVAVAAMYTLIGLHAALYKAPYRGRLRIKPWDLRTRWTFDNANRMFCDDDFLRAYRMERKTFDKLLFLVRPRLQKNVEMGRRSGRRTLCAEARLGILLRMMGGESVTGCMSAFEVGRSTVYHVLNETEAILNHELDLPGLPDTFDGLKKLSDGFQLSRYPPSPLPGCVGALDGISIKIKKPSNSEHPATFYCRKGYYAIPVQALVDSNYRFLCFSAKCRGSTHDSLAHAVSSLGRYLESGRFACQFWIAGDEAYVCTECLITPIPASQASDVEDAFNFYHSSLRMHVEQSFGMMVRKWRLLKRLEYSVDKSARFVGLAMKLHNFCLDHGDKAHLPQRRTVRERRLKRQMIYKSSEWYEDAKHYHFEQMGRRGYTSSTKRGMLVEIIRAGQYRRPSAAPIRVPSNIRVSSP